MSIRKQIVEHWLPKDECHICTRHGRRSSCCRSNLLVAANKVSEGMYQVLHEVMRHADIDINTQLLERNQSSMVGTAVIYAVKKLWAAMAVLTANKCKLISDSCLIRMHL